MACTITATSELPLWHTVASSARRLPKNELPCLCGDAIISFLPLASTMSSSSSDDEEDDDEAEEEDDDDDDDASVVPP